VVLHNYLLPQDCLRVMARERITGLTAVPPLWIQLAEREWPEQLAESLRYFANTGGAMPLPVLQRLRQRAPKAAPVLMYGLTEAFRSTWLPPEEVDRRPGSIGKAIPGAEILVLRPDGSECQPGEPGELVHRGPTVTLGYWNDPVRTAERFRPAPCRPGEVQLPEMAVWSGDIVERDADGFLYFIGRRDEQIKTSGYRVSPTEVEQAVQDCEGVVECVVFGVPDERLGQAIVAVVHGDFPDAESDAASPAVLPVARIHERLKNILPAYMLPRTVSISAGPLPRGANGKLDRRAIAADWLAGSCVPVDGTMGQA
jgi:acyl-CoA synthetase (AMP-forming)/AMP-acid ligase II